MVETNRASSRVPVRGLAATALFGSIVCLFFMTSVRPQVYFDLVSAIIVPGMVLLASCMSHRPGEILRAVSMALYGQADPSGEAIRILASARGYALSFGAFGFLTGTMGMLASIDDPSQIGMGLAIALTSVLYGLLLSEAVLQPLMLRISRGAVLPAGVESGPPRAFLVIVCTLGGAAFASLGVVTALMTMGSPRDSQDLHDALKEVAAGAEPATWFAQGERRIEVRPREGDYELVGRGDFFDDAGSVLPAAREILADLGSRIAPSRNRLEILVGSGPQEALGLARAQSLRAVLRDEGGVPGRRLEIRSSVERAPEPEAAFVVRVSYEFVRREGE